MCWWYWTAQRLCRPVLLSSALCVRFLRGVRARGSRFRHPFRVHHRCTPGATVAGRGDHTVQCTGGLIRWPLHTYNASGGTVPGAGIKRITKGPASLARERKREASASSSQKLRPALPMVCRKFLRRRLLTCFSLTFRGRGPGNLPMIVHDGCTGMPSHAQQQMSYTNAEQGPKGASHRAEADQFP